MPVAIIHNNVRTDWLNDDIPNENVKIALQEFISDIQQGRLIGENSRAAVLRHRVSSSSLRGIASC